MIKNFFKRLLGKQRLQLTVINIDGSQRRVVYETDRWIEAPNWSPDGKWLVFNGDGKLFRIAAEPIHAVNNVAPELIETGDVHNITNDHVIAPDGKSVYFTANGAVYVVPWSGGSARRVSAESSTHFYVHGVSPDGQLLSCVGYANQASGNPLAIYLMSVVDGTVTRLTDTDAPVDGAEFSRDGQWIYFNGELHAKSKGHSQIYRMRVDGTGIQQLTFDDRVNWFPHVRPDDATIVYLSYAPNTQGHPANVDVLLRRLSLSDGKTEDVVAIRGGQGSINTNSWAPDGDRFAYVALKS